MKGLLMMMIFVLCWSLRWKVRSLGCLGYNVLTVRRSRTFLAQKTTGKLASRYECRCLFLHAPASSGVLCHARTHPGTKNNGRLIQPKSRSPKQQQEKRDEKKTIFYETFSLSELPHLPLAF